MMTYIMVCLLQADQASKNFIRIMRLSNVSGRKRKLVPEQLEDSENDSESDEDEDDNENGLSKIPTLQARTVLLLAVAPIVSW